MIPGLPARNFDLDVASSATVPPRNGRWNGDSRELLFDESAAFDSSISFLKTFGAGERLEFGDRRGRVLVTDEKFRGLNFPIFFTIMHGEIVD